MSFSAPVSRRNVSKASAAAISVSLPFGASRSNQQRKRAIAAPSRMCAARAPASSALFLTAFISAIGSGPTIAVPPAASSAWVSRAGALAASKATRRPARAEPRHEAGRANRARRCRPMRRAARASRSTTCARRRTASARPSRGSIGEAQRQRRMRDVGAADVEQPGDGVRVADEEAVFSLEGGARRGPFFPPRSRRPRRAGCALTAPSGAAGRSLPDRVDRVRVDRDELAAGGAARLAEALDHFGRMQPGVVAEARARLQIGLDPRARRLLGDGTHREDRADRPALGACTV